MKESWFKNSDGARMGASAWETLDDLRKQFTRNVDMRMKRGDVRAAILRLLTDSSMHGYQIIHEISTRSGGAWKPSPGSVYPALQLLADEGLVASKESAGKRTYSLTDAGRAVADGVFHVGLEEGLGDVAAGQGVSVCWVGWGGGEGGPMQQVG